MIETLGGIATLTAWGDGKPLDDVLAFLANETDAVTVELAIGALPVADPVSVLGMWGGRFSYVGHHNMPVGNNQMLRPTLKNLPTIVEFVKAFELHSYSAHPPAGAGLDEFRTWAEAYFRALRRVGCNFAVETMFPSAATNEPRHFLSTYPEIITFLDWTSAIRWPLPLLVDVSHLHIAWRRGTWAMADIHYICEETRNVAREIHVSCNDGERDQHRPLQADTFESVLVDKFFTDKHAFVVDEGRRRGNVKPNRNEQEGP